MASGEIKVTTDATRMKAGVYRTEFQNVSEVISKMDSLLQTMLAESDESADIQTVSKMQEVMQLLTEDFDQNESVDIGIVSDSQLAQIQRELDAQ